MTLASQLDWLPKPDKEALRLLEELDPETLKVNHELSRLANHAWDEQQLRQLGRRTKSSYSNSAGLSASSLPRVRLLIFSQATFRHMADTLVGAGLRCGIQIDVTIVEFKEPRVWLESSMGSDKFDFVLICSLVGKSLFADLASDGDSAETTAKSVANDCLNLAKLCAEKLKAKVIIELQVDNLFYPLSNSDLKLRGSQRRQLALYNEALAEGAERDGYFILDTPLLASMIGHSNWTDPRLFHYGKMPFRSDFSPLYLTRLSNILAASSGKSRRVMVTDLDNTMWGGVIGDDGLAGIAIGNGSPKGESFLAMQNYLLALKKRGILLCIASKNTHNVAIDAFVNHPDVILKKDDFTAMRINWNDKASSIREMAETLNLGLEAFVFIDDNPAERKRVRDELPQVAVPELDLEPANWPLQLAMASYFEFSTVTNEDALRNEFYQAETRRNEIKKEAVSETQFLQSLKMSLDIKRFDETGRKRIVQLISKSNQFNLTSVRYSEAEVAALQNNKQAVCLQVRLADMFGDSGMISCLVAQPKGNALEIELWIMSCRVIGRWVEQALLQHLVQEALRLKLDVVEGVYKPSQRNALVIDHYKNMGFQLLSERDGETRWQLKLSDYKLKQLPFFEITKG